MDKKEQRRLAKQRKKEKRFVRKYAIASALAALVLTLFVGFAYKSAPSFLMSEIDFALEKRNFARAEKIAGYLGDEAVLLVGQRISYINAEELLKGESFDEAMAAFRALGDFEDAPSRAKEAGYLKAEKVFGDAKYEEAIALYSLVGGYADSMYKINKAWYMISEAHYADGEFREALEGFEALGDFEDAAQRRIDIAKRITGIDDPEEALLAASGLTDEELDRLNRLNERRKMVRNGIIAVGNRHTCAVASDGSVLAAGDNSCGQLNVSDWSGVVSVDAGAKHTIALTGDGRVLATGDNTYGQTNVSEWTDVIMIAAGAYDTYALTSDGRVLHAGFTENSAVGDWQDVSYLCAGSYAAGALYGNGAMIASEAACAYKDASGFIMADVSTAYGVGVMKSGEARATFGELNWKDCVFLSAGGAGVLGIDINGNVLSRFFRSTDHYDFSDLICVSVAAGGGHHAVVLEDGSVRVFGSNEFGQANTEGWKLF